MTQMIVHASRRVGRRVAGSLGLRGLWRPGDSATLRLFVTTVFIFAMPIVVNACPVCFGNPNSPLSKGATNGVLFLLGIIGIVQIGFVALFITFWRRARAMKKFREQFQVIEGGVR